MVDSSPGESRSRYWFWGCVLLVFVAFAAYGTMRSPIPGANEPNYLSKAKNFWDPVWCARDLYLQSGNSHWVFYATFGWVTRFLSFEQTAWVGRLIVWGLLAVGWVRMTDRLIPGGGRFGGSLLAAVLFLAWSAFTNTYFAGEWVIGGVEGKAFAFAGIWLGIGALFAGRLREAAIWMGLAISFHPVVGVWSLFCTAIAVLTFSWRDFWNPRRDTSVTLSSECHTWTAPWPPGLRPWIAPAILLVLASLPGIIPAATVLTDNPGPELVREADDIQIFIRLKHHLDASTFSAFAYQAYAVLLTAWLILLKPATRTASQRWFARYIVASLVVALAGVALAWLVFAARELQYEKFLPMGRFLKFYLYRAADLLLPIGVALQLAALMATSREQTTTESQPLHVPGHRPRRQLSQQSRIALCVLIGVIAFGYSLFKPFPPPPPAVASVVTPGFVADWKEVCAWIRDNTPSDSLFVIPRFNRNFKWYAERAEYFSWKDCPQDTSRILEWNRRRLWLEEWGYRHFMNDRGTQADLQDLATRTEPDRADYVILYSRLAVDDQPYLYKNGSFAVYSLARQKD